MTDCHLCPSPICAALETMGEAGIVTLTRRDVTWFAVWVVDGNTWVGSGPTLADAIDEVTSLRSEQTHAVDVAVVGTK